MGSRCGRSIRCVQYFFFFSSRRRHTRLQGDWSSDVCSSDLPDRRGAPAALGRAHAPGADAARRHPGDRKSTRLNSSHLVISYAVFCLKKKKNSHSLTLLHSRRTPHLAPTLFCSLSPTHIAAS